MHDFFKLNNLKQSEIDGVLERVDNSTLTSKDKNLIAQVIHEQRHLFKELEAEGFFDRPKMDEAKSRVGLAVHQVLYGTDAVYWGE